MFWPWELQIVIITYCWPTFHFALGPLQHTSLMSTKKFEMATFQFSWYCPSISNILFHFGGDCDASCLVEIFCGQGYIKHSKNGFSRFWNHKCFLGHVCWQYLWVLNVLMSIINQYPEIYVLLKMKFVLLIDLISCPLFIPKRITIHNSH